MALDLSKPVRRNYDKSPVEVAWHNERYALFIVQGCPFSQIVDLCDVLLGYHNAPLPTVSVPEEPTEEMVRAMRTTWSSTQENRWGDIYKAAIAARPQEDKE